MDLGLTDPRSGDATIWITLAPGLVAAAYFVGAMVVFTGVTLVRGLPRDAEVGPRGRTVIIGFYLRHYFFWAVSPLWRVVLRSGIPATGITMLSALLGAASGFAVASGHFALGGWVFLLSGILDTLDGRVARVRGEVSPAGSALDSVLDRYTDSAVLIGLAWYYRGSWVLLPVLLALFGGSMVPYVRAKGESLGVAVRGGTLQRAERVLVLGGALAVSPAIEAAIGHVRPTHGLVVAALVFLAAGSNVTAIARLIDLLRVLRGPRGPGHRRWSTQVALGALAAALATGFDYGIFVELVTKVGLTPALATGVGAIAGGFLNFHLNRIVTYRSAGAQLPEAARYALVSAMSAFLNAGGVAVLTMNPELDFRVAWWIVRSAVFLLWNLPLQRIYVFPATATPADDERDAAD